MWLLLGLSRLFQPFTSIFGRSTAKEIRDVDLTDVYQFRKIAEITVDISEDMYCNTLDMAGCGNNYFKFLTHPRYNGQVYSGKSVKEFGASVKKHLPKTLVWDWDGDPEGSGCPPVRIIAMRGTHSKEEWEGNFDCEEVTAKSIGITPDIGGVFHRDFGKTGWTLWKNLKEYIQNSDKPVVITGHSRGGGLAHVLHVIAKKNTPNVPIYTFSYAAPPTMYLTDSDELTKDIYGFVFRNDGIPRFFVGDIIDTFCRTNLVCNTMSSIIAHVAEKCTSLWGFTFCSDSSLLSVAVTVLSDFIFPFIPSFSQSYLTDGLKAKAGLLANLWEKYQDDKRSIKITQHVGNLYMLDWVNSNSTVEDKNMWVGCVKKSLTLDMVTPAHTLTRFSEMGWNQKKGSLSDHDPRPYRHAIHDPECVSLTKGLSEEFSDYNPFATDYQRMSLVEEVPDELPDITYPDWMPAFTDDDDCVFCDRSCLDSMPDGVGNGSCMSQFSWDNTEENWSCTGIMIDCNQSYILGATCTNETSICLFNWTTKEDKCFDLPQREAPVTPRNRCMSSPDDDCYMASITYNYSSSGSSCNANAVSSSGSSNNGQSSSGSSNEVKSSVPISNKQFCDDPRSCATDLGDFVIQSVYLGGNPIVPFPLAYTALRTARSTFGKIVPPPNFQHTAVWFGESDRDGDDSQGAILVYGEYYNYNGDPTYLECDGARSFVMTLGEFKNTFRSFQAKKMKPGRNITLTTLLDEVQKSGSWDAESYNWAVNNCQHFSASVLQLLQAKRADARADDWADIPPPVMRSILRTELVY